MLNAITILVWRRPSVVGLSPGFKPAFSICTLRLPAGVKRVLQTLRLYSSKAEGYSVSVVSNTSQIRSEINVKRQHVWVAARRGC